LRPRCPARADRRATPFAFDPRARLGAPRAFPPWAAASRRAHLDEIADAVDLTSQHGTTVTSTGVIKPGETREAFRAALCQRLDNIEAAIRRAKKIRGGVSIE